MKKREEFAVSLRKKKKAEILNVKREKRIKMVYDTKPAVENQIYSSCPLFSQSQLDELLHRLVPDFFKLKPVENHSDVSDNDMAEDVNYKIEQVKMLLERIMAPK